MTRIYTGPDDVFVEVQSQPVAAATRLGGVACARCVAIGLIGEDASRRERIAAVCRTIIRHEISKAGISSMPWRNVGLQHTAFLKPLGSRVAEAPIGTERGA